MKRIGLNVALAIAMLAGCAKAPQVRPLLWKDVPYGFAEHEATVAGHRIVYVDEGPRSDPEPLVLIHGLGGDLSNFRRTIPTFAAVKRVIAIDLPGFGKSEKKLDADYRPTFEAGAVIGLLDSLAIRRATLVGNSMGGLISAWAAIQHPDRVGHLVLVDAAGLIDASWLADVMLDWVFSEQRMRENAWRDPSWAEGLLFVKPPPDWPATYERTYFVSKTDPQWPTYARVFRNAYQGIRAESLEGRLGDIEVPTLVAWGKKDGLLDLDHAFAFHEGIRGSVMAIFPGCGHVPQWECPDAFDSALANFLGVKLPEQKPAPKPTP